LTSQKNGNTRNKTRMKSLWEHQTSCDIISQSIPFTPDYTERNNNNLLNMALYLHVFWQPSFYNQKNIYTRATSQQSNFYSHKCLLRRKKSTSSQFLSLNFSLLTLAPAASLSTCISIILYRLNFPAFHENCWFFIAERGKKRCENMIIENESKGKKKSF